jgi:predicted Zn-dependent peptidase
MKLSGQAVPFMLVPEVREREIRDIEMATLPNGLKVITESMSHVRSVSVGIWLAIGSRRETAKQNGISHFIEHMLFKGTTNRSAEQLAREVDSIGGNLDAFTAKELVSFNVKVLDEHLERGFDILSDLVLHPLFQPEDVEKEKGVILEELKMEVDNPEYLIHEMYCGTFWHGHPLGRSILGTKETIRSFTPQMVREYYDSAYVPSNMLITAAGNLRHEELLGLVRERFAALPGCAAGEKEPTPRTHAEIKLKNKRSLEQTHVCLGVPIHPLPHEMRYACYVLNTVLGGGMSSRLFQNIREKLGLAYAVFSELNAYRDSASLVVYAGTSTEAAPRVVDLILQEFRQLKDCPLSPDEIRRAKDHLKGSLMLSLESTSSRMANLARQEIFFGRFFTLDEIADAVEAVTTAEVRQVACDFFRPELITLCVLGRMEELKFAREQLAC